jgi:hypothetical protein
MNAHNLSDHRQSNAGAGNCRAFRSVAAYKLFENSLFLFGRNPDALIPNPYYG